ncbi:antA/AntB antirepressor family protein [Microvirgula aerodenitrificans]|uniref:antA/AntB antirepressor family protein n=1 Tax=Microvirgula aerodenitrificans TaxID=57480 RepID=UPI001B803C78|nr:antA/AntB antirepressor family protein [Microvirgula aerodenitrificans]
MAAQTLVPVFAGTINNESVLLCDARLLHGFLRVGRRFASWITERISEYGFVENQDFVAISQKREIGHGRGRTDYHLTIDTAKELAMVERNEQGRAVRRYFIECEKRLRQMVKPATTTTDARTPLRAAVSMLVGKKGLMYPDAYALVHQRFGVEHIDQLAPEQIGQAVEYVHRLVLEGEVLPAEKKGAYHFPKETAAPHDFERRAFINVNMTPDVLLDSRNRAPELELIEALERDGHDVAGAKIRILALRDAAAWQVKLLAMMEDVRWRLGHQADRIRQCTDQRGMNVVFDKKPTKKMVAAAQGALPLGSA